MSTPAEERVLIHAPIGRDGLLTQQLLADAGIAAQALPSLDELCQEANAGAAALLVAEEALTERGLDRLSLLVRAQPPWSDLQIIVSTTRGATTDARVRRLSSLAEHANVIILERPVRVLTMVATVRSALRARRRQYEMRDLTAEAERARATAEAANRAKDEFLAMLGHELRNPLSPILTALELMRLRDEDAVASERAVIERQARHMASLVDDLLDVSRITRGKIVLKRERVNLAEALAKAIETAAPLLEQRRHHLVVDVPNNELYVDGDPARLTQIFSNVLTNAAKYTDDGGRIEVSASRVANGVEIAVRDNGRGITPAMLPQVFGLFTQEGQNLDRSHGGLGLGLAIVKKLVEMHDGDVRAESEGVGRGSRFTVRLPLVEAPAQVSRPAPRASAAVQLERRTDRPVILIVDDNTDAAEMLAELLDDCGYTPRIAHDGPQALALAGREQPAAAALLDIGLPVMDGYELARRLRDLPGWRDVWLAAITGYGQEHDRARSREAGFQQHLVKPIDAPRLASLLSEVIAPATIA